MPRIRKCDLNRERRRAEAYQRLNELFPIAFPLDDAAIQPLALTSRDDLYAALEAQAIDAALEAKAIDQRRQKRLVDAMRQHCSRVTYQQTVVAGAMRITLQGEPTEPVTPEGQAYAERKIAAILRDQEARAQREAEREAAKAAEKAAKAQPNPKAKAKAKAKPVTPTPAPASVPPPAKMPVVVVKKKRRVVSDEHIRPN